jgi:hypothetical protein
MHFRSRKEKFGAFQKCYYFNFLFFLNCVTCNSVNREVSVLKQEVSALHVCAEFIDVAGADSLLPSFFSVNVN